jgi:hypothetical protein
VWIAVLSGKKESTLSVRSCGVARASQSWDFVL